MLVVAALTVSLTGCGPGQIGVPGPHDQPVAPSSTPGPTLKPDQRLVGAGLVLDEGSGAELCMGPMTASIPPQCAGIPLVGWKWPADGWSRDGDVRSGSYAVVGIHENGKFRVEKIVDLESIPELDEGSEGRDFRSPCPVPKGGWRAEDPSRATQETEEAAIQAAEKLPDYAELWIDDLGDDAQDPAKIVLNVSVTDDLGRAESAMRKVWGGALCVSRGARTQQDVLRIQAEVVEDLPGVTGAGTNRGVIEVTVDYDDGTLQQQVDEKYGLGAVRVISGLRPYPL